MKMIDQEFKEKATEVFKGMVERQLLISCLNCINWNGHDEKCTLAKSRPPASVIVFGCQAWEPDIPF